MGDVIGFPKPQRKTDPDLLERIRRWPCCVCGMMAPSDPSHIRSVGAGGPDTDWNVVPMCRGCHREWHNIGPERFLMRNPPFMQCIVTLGWRYESGRLWHPELR